MNIDDARLAIGEALAASINVVAHLKRLQARMSPLFPLTPDQLEQWGDAEREQLHAFLRLFEKLHELIGRSLFRGTMILQREETASLSARDLHERLEQLGVIESAKKWGELGDVRNMLVHDYPTTHDKQAVNSNAAWDALDTLIAVHGSVENYIRHRNLI